MVVACRGLSNISLLSPGYDTPGSLTGSLLLLAFMFVERYVFPKTKIIYDDPKTSSLDSKMKASRSADAQLFASLMFTM